MNKQPDVQPQIRRIQPGDGSALRRIRLSAISEAPYAFGSTLAQIEERTDASWSELANQYSSDPDTSMFFAEDHGELCGIAGGVPSDDDPHRPEVISMWVAPTHRRRGLGRALVGAVIAWAREAGYSRISLWVTDTNLPAKALYAATGFEPTEILQPVPSNPSLQERMFIRDL